MREQNTMLTVSQITFARLMSLIAMAFLWIGSQIPVYLFGMPQNDLRFHFRLETARSRWWN